MNPEVPCGTPDVHGAHDWSQGGLAVYCPGMVPDTYVPPSTS